MSAPRRVRIGFAAAAAVYVLASIITIETSGHRLRPLYEGIGPAPPYRWVHPPAAFKSTNIEPLASSQPIQLTSAGSEQTGVATTDGQLVLSLPLGAIPTSSGQTGAVFSITPVDPARLGRLPAGTYSDGNAYRIAVTYQPGSALVASAQKPIDAILHTPVGSVALLESADGRTWSRIQDHHIPTQAAVATTFTHFGYLLAVTNIQVVSPASSSGTNTALVVVLGVAAIALLAVSIVWRRRGRIRSGRQPPITGRSGGPG